MIVAASNLKDEPRDEPATQVASLNLAAPAAVVAINDHVIAIPRVVDSVAPAPGALTHLRYLDEH